MRINYRQYYSTTYPGYFYQVPPSSVKRMHTKEGGDKSNRKVGSDLETIVDIVTVETRDRNNNQKS